MVGHVRIAFKTSPQGVDWPTLDATWALAGGLDVFEAGWMNDHLTGLSPDHDGASYEPLTVLAALAHHVPGRDLGVAVLSNTFRHPSVLAKQATALDNITGGRFILGLGSGWHEGEHRALGIPLPPLPERFDRFERSLRVLQALFSPAATHAPGVTIDDPQMPLHEATNRPAPLRPGGPAIWLGGQKRRGIDLAARFAEGWLLPGDRAGDVAYFADRRDALQRALEAVGRDPDAFAYAGQVAAGATAESRRDALTAAIGLARAGATDVIVGVPARLGPDALAAGAAEVAVPLRERLG